EWGIVDVEDCVAAVQALVRDGLADGERLGIRGGSAGGWTTLAALTTTDAFAAGLEKKGIPHAYLPFAGEQHGFRKQETVVAALEAELSFYGYVFGFGPP